ncbi:MurR/RpiR family transcriptional regulator [Candidatus Enterococcus ferrettii]|uniref:HTH rpiR-type domain-containing protein n=1 Tax=Candidatus Enterococcus ferrettii TaxID=2815324 RepID=A0ABV0EXJ0_9ENTE|nr:MurR/RpiR family transcriptional regulator [Enterococcus sp. 665A]MBO1339397.1 MurR/RpiR family transcriptional regulator [Enterococcus sp. 665A]
MRLQLDRLNELETQIHQKLSDISQERPSMTITEAAEATGVSPSKISKFVKKIGFSGYKEYFRFLTGKELIKKKKLNSEFARIQDFMENFDAETVSYLAEQIKTHDKIILFGYGPTSICMEYFGYKLTYIIDKNVIQATQSSMIPSLLTENSLLLVFTVAGKFAQFDHLFEEAKRHHTKALLIIEEFNASLNLDQQEIIYLTKSHQDEQLNSHEKTRTVLMMFIEEVIRELSKQKD